MVNWNNALAYATLKIVKVALTRRPHNDCVGDRFLMLAPQLYVLSHQDPYPTEASDCGMAAHIACCHVLNRYASVRRSGIGGWASFTTCSRLVWDPHFLKPFDYRFVQLISRCACRACADPEHRGMHTLTCVH